MEMHYTTTLYTNVDFWTEIAVLLKTKSRGDTGIMYYSAKNGQYLCLKRKKLQSMGAEMVANKVNYYKMHWEKYWLK